MNSRKVSSAWKKAFKVIYKRGLLAGFVDTWIAVFWTLVWSMLSLGKNFWRLPIPTWTKITIIICLLIILAVVKQSS